MRRNNFSSNLESQDPEIQLDSNINVNLTKYYRLRQDKKNGHIIDLKKNPSSRIWTSDLRISDNVLLQSTALPTELSKEI